MGIITDYPPVNVDITMARSTIAGWGINPHGVEYPWDVPGLVNVDITNWKDPPCFLAG
jgi:hypothetical protein